MILFLADSKHKRVPEAQKEKITLAVVVVAGDRAVEEVVLVVVLVETKAFQPHQLKMLASSRPWLPNKGATLAWIR